MLNVTLLSPPKLVGNTVCPAVDFSFLFLTIINKIAATKTKMINVSTPITIPINPFDSFLPSLETGTKRIVSELL